MAQITVVYKDFNEMVAVARELLKGIGTEEEHMDTPAEDTAISTGIAQATQRTPQEMVRKVPEVQAVQTPEPVQTQEPAVPGVAVPTTTRTYTLDELASAAMTLMDKGMQTQLQELLAGFGVEALPALPQEKYGDFATALRGMGAQI